MKEKQKKKGVISIGDPVTRSRHPEIDTCYVTLMGSGDYYAIIMKS